MKNKSKKGPLGTPLGNPLKYFNDQKELAKAQAGGESNRIQKRRDKNKRKVAKLEEQGSAAYGKGNVKKGRRKFERADKLDSKRARFSR